MPLPTQRREAAPNFGRAKILVYGEPKVGKSTFAASFPDALILDCEVGYIALGGLIAEIGSGVDLERTILELERLKPPFPYKWVVLDSVTSAWRLMTTDYCKKSGVNTDAEVEFGKGPPASRQNFENLIERLKRLPCGFVLVAHTEKEAGTGKAELHIPTSFDKNQQPIRSYLNAAFDIVLYAAVEKDGNNEGKEIRVLHTNASTKHYAGDRFGVLPKMIRMSYSDLVEPFRQRHLQLQAAKAQEKKDTVTDDSVQQPVG